MRRWAPVFSIAISAGSLAPVPVGGQNLIHPLRLEPHPLRTSTGETVAAELGHLLVPERYGSGDNRYITLAFARLKSSGSSHSPPIVYLAGGPGSSGIAAARGASFNAIRALTQFGDVILLDQRGTGLSRPQLDCPGLFHYPLDESVDRQRMTAALSAFAKSCAGTLRRRGVHLSAYNTENSADDLASLRNALGVSQLRLIGESYGTHLALAAIRRHPALIERAVLIGVEGPDQTIKLPENVDRHLDDVSALIAADPQARTELPDYKSQLAGLLTRLRRAPIRVATRLHDASRTAVTVRISAFDVQQIAAALLGRRATIELIPSVFGPAMRGDLSQIAAYAAENVRTAQVTAMGSVMDCASLGSPERLRTIARQIPKTILGTSADYPLPDWCQAWKVPSLPNEFRARIHSDVPVLMVAGTLDGLTPVSNALEVRRGFTNGVLFTIAGGAHDTLVSSGAVRAAIGQFLNGTSMVDAVFPAPPIRFKPVKELQ